MPVKKMNAVQVKKELARLKRKYYAKDILPTAAYLIEEKFDELLDSIEDDLKDEIAGELDEVENCAACVDLLVSLAINQVRNTIYAGVRQALKPRRGNS